MNLFVTYNVIGWGWHPLTGQFKDIWVVKVSGNYRIIFRLIDGACFDVDYLDYH